MRTIENVRLMKKILLQELNQLPETNQLGDSNEYDRNRLHGWIIDLTHIEHFGTINDQESEISLWLKDECWNPLCSRNSMSTKRFCAWQLKLKCSVRSIQAQPVASNCNQELFTQRELSETYAIT